MAKYTAILVVLFYISYVYAEHSGAYSSPQYAKKMYPKMAYDNDNLLPSKPAGVFKRHQSSEVIDRSDSEANLDQNGRSSFLDTAGNFLSGSGGQMVASLAKDFLARSTGSSQVGFDCITQVRIAPFSYFARFSLILLN